MLEDGDEDEEWVKEDDGVRHEEGLLLHAEDSHEDGGGGIGGPKDNKERQDEPHEVAKLEDQVEGREDDDGDQMVAEDRGQGPVRDLPLVGEQRDDEVKHQRAEHAKAENVAEMKFTPQHRDHA